MNKMFPLSLYKALSLIYMNEEITHMYIGNVDGKQQIGLLETDI